MLGVSQNPSTVACGSEIPLSNKEQNLAHTGILWKWRGSSPELFIHKKKANHLDIQVKWLCMVKWLGFDF